MSLDVYLTIEGAQRLELDKVVPIREHGQQKMISQAEWHERFPNREPHFATPVVGDEVYSANITHNLTTMAAEARIYMHIWRPEEIDIKIAGQLIFPLRQGLELLESNPERFEKLNPESGWGTYRGLVDFVHEYLVACERYPRAEVSTCR